MRFLGHFTLSIVSTISAFGLTERQSEYVRQLGKGLDPIAAARAAGYSELSAQNTNQINSPAVLAALHELVQRSLKADVPVNLIVLKKIRDDDAAPARVRADIGLQLMKLAGHVAPTTREDKPQKALSDMTQAELLEHIERNQAAIEKAEAELMAKAKDITPADSVTDSVPMTHDTQDKSLNYLD